MGCPSCGPFMGIAVGIPRSASLLISSWVIMVFWLCGVATTGYKRGGWLCHEQDTPGISDLLWSAASPTDLLGLILNN